MTTSGYTLLHRRTAHLSLSFLLFQKPCRPHIHAMKNPYPHGHVEKCERNRLDILAVDLANAYVKFLDEFPKPKAVTMDRFDDFFVEQRLEYLLYAGSTANSAESSPFSVPYNEVIVSDLLQLSAAYLYLPAEIARPHTRWFGLLLCYHFYSVQPQRGEASCLAPTRIRIAVGVLEDLLARLEEQAKVTGGPSLRAADSSSTPDSGAVLPSSLLALGLGPSPGSSTPSPSSLPSSSPPDALTEAEVTALLSLHKHRAWQTQPYERNGPHLRALMKAHESIGASASLLLPSGRTSTDEPLKSESAFARELCDYETAMANMGL